MNELDQLSRLQTHLAELYAGQMVMRVAVHELAVIHPSGDAVMIAACDRAIQELQYKIAQLADDMDYIHALRHVEAMRDIYSGTGDHG